MSRAAVAPRLTTIGVFLAFARLCQVGLVLATVWLLLVVRTSQSPVLLICTVLVTTATVGVTARHAPTVLAWAGYILAFVTFVIVRRAADETFMPTQHSYVIHLEKALFLGTEPTVWLQRHFHQPGHTSSVEAAMVGIYLSYFLAPHVVAFLIWRFRRTLFIPYLTLIACTFISGLVIYFVVPTQPPWLASESGHLGHVTRVVRDTTTQVSGSAYEQGNEVAGSNEVAAMPSLHMAITAAIALVAWRVRRLWGIVATLYAAAMGLTLIYTGEHYTIDLLAGVALAATIWFVIRRLFDLNAQTT